MSVINLRNGLSSAFNIRPGDGLALSLLFVTALFKGIATLFLETAANTKFLSDFGIGLLPYVYIVVAVISLTLGFVYIKLENKISPLLLMKGLLLFLTVVLGSLYALVLLTEAKWVSMALMIWKDVYWILIEMVFWAVAGFLFNVRQGKRLFGLVAAGDMLPNVVCGFAMPWIVRFTGTVHLLLIATIALGLCFLMLIVTEKALGHRFTGEEERKAEKASRKSLRDLARARFSGLLFLLTPLAVISYFLLEYIFYIQVESVYTDEAALAGFFGVFFAVLNLANLLMSGAITGRLLTRFGIIAGLVAAPAVVSLGILSALIALVSLAFTGFVWILIGTKLLHEIANESVTRPTFQLLYQPLRPRDRLRTQAVCESVIVPAATGLSGLLLLLLVEVWGLDSVSLSFILIAFVAATFIAAFLIRREYVLALTTAINRRQLSGGFLSFDDASSLQVLKEKLNSNIPVEVITSLKLLENSDHPSFNGLLVEGLGHPREEVVKYTLERIEAKQLATAADRVLSLVGMEGNNELRGKAVRVFCELRQSEALVVASPLLDSDAVPLRRGAMIGLLRSGVLEGVLLANARLGELLESSDSAERVFAAELLGDVGITDLYRPLLELLNDENAHVQRAAIVAAGKVRNTQLAAPLVALLREPSLRECASRALVSFGGAALPELASSLDSEETTSAERIRLIRLMGRIGNDASTRRLLGHLTTTNRKAQRAMLNELAARNYQADADMSAAIRHHIEQEVQNAVWVLAQLVRLSAAVGMDLLTKALESEARESRERILLLLSFLFPSRGILNAKEKLLSDHVDVHANGLELLDELLSGDVRAIAMLLFDNVSADQQLAQFRGRLLQENSGKEIQQRELMTCTSLFPWTRACAIYSAGKARDESLLDTVYSAISDPEPLVRETAAWAVSVMDPERFAPIAERLGNDPNSNVRRLVAHWRQKESGPGETQPAR